MDTTGHRDHVALSTISYAQNFEDVMLARALGDIDAGFYVDVGAQDPVVDSVTRLFYERGWRGINIEPVGRWYERLQADRPDDVNVRCAVGDHMGILALHAIADSGLSTSSTEFASEHVRAGRTSVIEDVPLATLDSILDAHAPGTIHFVKIDVEGMEKDVIAGFSLARYRPWILLVEATRPNQPVDVSDRWEPMVLEAGYTLVYRDGLNRFYLANEQMARAPAFALPPNVFDDFVTYREIAANRFAESLEHRLQGYHDRVQSLEHDLGAVADTAAARLQRLDEIEQVLVQREEILQERAALAERYRLDLLVVSGTADKRQQRLDELQQAMAEREAVLAVVSETADKRQQRLVELESRLAELIGTRHALQMATARRDALQAELDTVQSSRSWRLTSPLRSSNRAIRGLAGRLLRMAAGMPVLRTVGARLFAGRLRQRVLSLAGFGGDRPASDHLSQPATVSPALPSPVTSMSRSAARIHRILSAAAPKDDRGE